MVAFQVTPERCQKRARFLTDRLSDLQSLSKPSRYNDYRIHDAAAMATIEAYFLLNDAYKAHRKIPDDHKTEFSKVAAFTALSVGYLCPLRHKDLHRDSNVEDTIVNPMFAIRLAMHRVGANMALLSHEELDRLYEGFSGFQFATLNRYYSTLQTGARQLFDPFDIEFSTAELIFMEDKITIFALCEKLASYQKD